MKTARIRGMSLACALGPDRRSAVAALQTGCQNSVEVRLDHLTDPQACRYYRIDDGAELLDPQRMEPLLRRVVDAALGEAGLGARQRQQLPVFVGSSCLSIRREEARYASELESAAEQAMPLRHIGFDAVADAVRHLVGTHAPAMTFNTACSSAANALLAAQRALMLERWPMALVVGVELANLTTLAGFNSLQLVSDTVRPFDANRDGMVLGEGVSAVVLTAEPASSRLPRIAGGANTCDTHAVTGGDPDGCSIARLLQQTLAAAGVAPADIVAIKSHATGTPANDATEAHALHQVFTHLPPICALKPWLGHTLGACGLNELVLLASLLETGSLPATPGFVTPDEALGLTPLPDAWTSVPGHYLLNQFGFGGNNTALVLEWPC